MDGAESDDSQASWREYESCQSAANSSSDRCWTIVNIYIAVSLVGPSAAGLLLPIGGAQLTNRCLMVIAAVTLAVGAIAIVWMAKKMVDRERWYLRITYYRVRELEKELSWWRNRYTFYLDKWDDTELERKLLPQDVQSKLKDMHCTTAFVRPPDIGRLLSRVAWIATGMWIVLAVSIVFGAVS